MQSKLPEGESGPHAMQRKEPCEGGAFRGSVPAKPSVGGDGEQRPHPLGQAKRPYDGREAPQDGHGLC